MMNNERLCTLAQRGDTQAQEQLIQNNLGYIRKTANELYISVGLGNSECNLRRAAATGAFASGHSAEHNGHLY